MQGSKNFSGLTALVGLALLIGSQPTAYATNLPRADVDVGSIDWKPCDSVIECGRLEVPLDYNNPSAGTASLSLARYPATNKTARLGTLLTNPGGPGNSGVGMIYNLGKTIGDALDGRYDIVSWDPRGVNGTTPQSSCFASETEQDIFYANAHTEVVPSTRNLADPIDYAVFRSQVRIADARNKMLGDLCYNQTGDALRYVGTASVARDMDRIFRSIEGNDKQVNFYGFSYGTYLGSTFINMFPDRVGRFILDGVVDPNVWTNNHLVEWPKLDYVDTEKVLRNFYEACVEAGPDRCVFASQGSSADDLSAAFQSLLDKLYEKPMPVPNAIRPGVLTEAYLRLVSRVHLSQPREWPLFAEAIVAAINGDGAPALNTRIAAVELDKSKPAKTISANNAVICLDTPSFDGMSEDQIFDHMMDELVKGEKVSPLFSTLDIEICQHWRVRPVERFTGPFNRTLSNQILVIGNTADTVTPLKNAVTVRNLHGVSARLLIQDGSGHCSPSMVSMCTVNAVRGYLLNGELPQDGMVCKTDEVLFPAKAGNLRSRSASEQNMSARDLELLQTFRDLGDGLAQHGSLLQARSGFML